MPLTQPSHTPHTPLTHHRSPTGLVSKYDIKLTADEQSFMDNQVEKLCALLDDYQVTRDRDMPEEVWEFLKQEKVGAALWGVIGW